MEPLQIAGLLFLIGAAVALYHFVSTRQKAEEVHRKNKPKTGTTGVPTGVPTGNTKDALTPAHPIDNDDSGDDHETHPDHPDFKDDSKHVISGDKGKIILGMAWDGPGSKATFQIKGITNMPDCINECDKDPTYRCRGVTLNQNNKLCTLYSSGTLRAAGGFGGGTDTWIADVMR
jgi:hypothetical protein